MTTLQASGPATATANGLEMPLCGDFRLRVDMLEDWLVRVAVMPDAGLGVDRTWTIAPDGDTPWEGRGRLALDGFSLPAVDADVGAPRSTATAGAFRILLDGDPLRLRFQRRRNGDWRTVLADREASAYQWFERRGTLRHFQARSPDERHYGLGDKTGPLDRTHRRFRCLQTDSLGYDAELSDPLYKHVPFLVAENDRDGATGIFYDTLAEIAFDLGAEHSNYYPHYRHVDAAEKGLVYYVIAGPALSDVVPRLARLTGRAHLPPRWSMGFAFTTMHHADAPNAQEVITGFAERCRANDIPISAIHSGSGYTTRADGRRYVFTWNRTKFPDRDGFFARLRELGFKTCANIKPVLLKEHPAYSQAAEAGWFVREGNGRPAVEMFWGGEGSSLDFTNPEAVAWWQESFRREVLGAGFDAGWNDNNEAELWDEAASVAGFGRPLPAIDVRPVQALLMTRATFEATRAAKPDERPYTISRAGPAGIARYGETWTGDNATSWHTLKWNLRNGLSMSLSGMPFVGHDIGGFAGPKADPELFVRWVQMMALHPRAVMNSWKPELDQPVNLPWMHPEVTDLVREALRLRYRFLSLLYSLAWECHTTGEPIIAPLLYHFRDAECRADPDAFMLGKSVLVVPVVGPGAQTLSIYLPAVEGGWHDFWNGGVLPGGQAVTVPSPLDRLPLFVRSGAVLPLAADWNAHAPHDASRVVLTAFPGGEAGASQERTFFDDGTSWRYRDKDASLLACRLRWDGERVDLDVLEQWSGRGRPDLGFEARGLSGRAFDHRLA